MIVFDLDDTLYLEQDFAFSGYRFLDDLIVREFNVAGFGDRCSQLFEAGERKHIFDIACRRLGIKVQADDIARLVHAYRGHFPDIDLCPDAATYLQNAKLPMGLITDGPEVMQRNKIAALGLEIWIAHLRPTGAWPDGFSKPHARAFEEMEAYSDSSRRMVYVADNPAKDFVTPKARGWVTVQILREGAVHYPDPPDEAHAAAFRIETLDELDAILSGAGAL